MSKAVIEKAQRLIRDGQVRELAQPRVFTVNGDHGRYTVVITSDAICTCPHTGICAHITAALLQIREETIAAHTAQLVD